MSLLFGQSGEGPSDNRFLLRIDGIRERVRDAFVMFLLLSRAHCQTLARAQHSQAINGPAASQGDQPRKRPATSFVKVFRLPPNLNEYILQYVLGLFTAIQYTDEQAK